MDLNIFVKNVYIILHSPAYKYITFYGSSHNSHENLTNCLINVDNFVQRQSALLNISNIQIYICKCIFIPLIYIFFNKEVGGRGTFAMFLGGLTPLKIGKLWFR